MLDRLLVKLNAADGLGILLVTPNGFPEASKFIQQHPNRFIGFGDIKLDDPDVLNQIGAHGVQMRRHLRQVGEFGFRVLDQRGDGEAGGVAVTGALGWVETRLAMDRI